MTIPSLRTTDPCRLICVTPTRNERWIIDRFLQAAKCWATDVIIADQDSTDGTREYAESLPGVRVFDNDSAEYDESQRQRLLIKAAREVEGRRVVIALDADEALSANWESKEWHRIVNAAPGTVLRFKWVNVLPGFEKAWVPPGRTAFGFVDDGSEHFGTRIHSCRVPSPPEAPVIDLEEIVVLHFQYVAWERSVSKQRWYQAWECANLPLKGAVDIFRQYHHMEGSWEEREIRPLMEEWLKGYNSVGIDFQSVVSEVVTWWDAEVVSMLSKQGTKRFRKIAIWDKDWNSLAYQLGVGACNLGDPRSILEKIAHELLRKTQGHRSGWRARGLELVLRLTGW